VILAVMGMQRVVGGVGDIGVSGSLSVGLTVAVDDWAAMCGRQ
jgi:hypothetical protein